MTKMYTSGMIVSTGREIQQDRNLNHWAWPPITWEVQLEGSWPEEVERNSFITALLGEQDISTLGCCWILRRAKEKAGNIGHASFQGQGQTVVWLIIDPGLVGQGLPVASRKLLLLRGLGAEGRAPFSSGGNCFHSGPASLPSQGVNL